MSVNSNRMHSRITSPYQFRLLALVGRRHGVWCVVKGIQGTDHKRGQRHSSSIRPTTSCNTDIHRTFSAMAFARKLYVGLLKTLFNKRLQMEIRCYVLGVSFGNTICFKAVLLMIMGAF